jgi:hypothetical protein
VQASTAWLVRSLDSNECYSLKSDFVKRGLRACANSRTELPPFRLQLKLRIASGSDGIRLGLYRVTKGRANSIILVCGSMCLVKMCSIVKV